MDDAVVVLLPVVAGREVLVFTHCLSIVENKGSEKGNSFVVVLEDLWRKDAIHVKKMPEHERAEDRGMAKYLLPPFGELLHDKLMLAFVSEILYHPASDPHELSHVFLMIVPIHQHVS